MRYSHYIMKKKPGKWPTSFFTVDCIYSIEDTGILNRMHTGTLVSWHAVCMTIKDGKYGIVKTMSGTTVDSYWIELRQYLQHSGQTWCLSYQCGRVWSLLDLFGGLEDGSIRLTGSDPRLPASRREAVRAVRRKSADPLGDVWESQLRPLLQSADGYMVVEDPPNIINCSVAGAQGKLQWVDLRNYGCEIPDSVPCGTERATWLAKWLMDAQQMLTDYHCGSLQTTAGSQAMAAWRTSYLQTGVYAHNDQRILALEMSAYYGGRCECYQIGSVVSGVWHLDVRSMYPAICASERLPCRLSHYRCSESGEDDLSALRGDGVIADCELETSEPAYPYRHHGDVVYPVGRYRTQLAGPELADAVQCGRVRRWFRLAVYHMDYCLSDFAKSLYQAREEYERTGNVAVATFVKRLLVSIVGKLGQRDKRWIVQPGMSTDLAYGCWYGAGDDSVAVRYRSIGFLVQKDQSLGVSTEAVPSIAAWITSLGRMQLLRAIRCIGWGDVYYCDTDSIFTSRQGYERICDAGLCQSGVLGKFQVKDEECSLGLRGIKYYVKDGRITCAGMPRGVTEDYGDGLHYWYYYTPVQQIEKGECPEVKRVLRPYRRAEEYRHGIVLSDGSVKPLRMEEW